MLARRLDVTSDRVIANNVKIQEALNKAHELQMRKYPPFVAKRDIAVNELDGNGVALFIVKFLSLLLLHPLQC